MSLTDTQIRQAKPKDKNYKLSDGRGLFLLVTHTGAKYWRVKYRIAGIEKLLSIGVYPSVSLKKARKVCTDAKDLLEQGIDPSQAKKSKKIEQLQAHTNNLEAIAMEWQKQQALRWSVGYSGKVLRSLKRDLFPYLGTLPLGDITPPQLLQVLRRVEARGATESAHRLKQTVKKTKITEDVAKDVWRSLNSHIFPSLGNLPVNQVDAPMVIDIINPVAAKGNLETVKRLLDVKKMCYPKPVKINIMFRSKQQMQYACINELKELLKVCSRQRLREVNGTND